jgi:hypothetical protein
MEEVLPGVWHWTARHPNIGIDVHSHWVADAAALLDPLEPPDVGIDWFREHGPPERVVLSNRHHLRHSERFAEEFGCPIVAPETGMHEFEGGPDVHSYSFGDEVAPGIFAREFAAISPDDAALHMPAGDGTLLFADGLIRYGELGFVPDKYLSDDPEGDKRAMVDGLRGLLELKFDNLLFAHGDPLIGGGKDALRRFVEERTDG